MLCHSHKKEIVWLLGPSCIVFTTKVEHARAAVQDVHAFQNIMAGVSKDFVSGDHCDTLLTLLDEDLLNADEDFTAEIANVVTKIGDLPSTKFKCDVCEKMCKSQQLSFKTQMLNIYHHTLMRTVLLKPGMRSLC